MRTLLNICFVLLGTMFFCTANAQGPVWDWTRQITGTGNVIVYPIAADNNDNVYVVGSYDKDTLIFTGDTAFYDYNSGFMARYDGAGNFKWARTLTALPCAIATDAAGSIYIAGFFTGNTFALDTFILVNSSENEQFRDAFVARLDSTGKVLWLAQLGGGV